jgi:hypothetical protein
MVAPARSSRPRSSKVASSSGASSGAPRPRDADDAARGAHAAHLAPPEQGVLDEWYRRIGYRVAHTTRVDETYPDLAPLLATPCQFVVYEKTL